MAYHEEFRERLREEGTKLQALEAEHPYPDEGVASEKNDMSSSKIVLVPHRLERKYLPLMSQSQRHKMMLITKATEGSHRLFQNSRVVTNLLTASCHEKMIVSRLGY